MEEQVKMRMKMVLKEFGTNPTQLANEYGVNQKTLNSHINGNTAVSLSTILLILKAIPNLSAEWLLRGEGNMVNGRQEENQDTSLHDEVIRLRAENDVLRELAGLNKKGAKAAG